MVLDFAGLAAAGALPRHAATPASSRCKKVSCVRSAALGEVGDVVADRNNRFYVVIEHGGFLGIGEDRVAFPIERFWAKGDALVIRGVTEADIDAMGDYRDSAERYREVADNAQAELTV